MDKTKFEETIRWYDENAQKYLNFTSRVMPQALLNKFLSLLPEKPKILDAGCGPGRDSQFFYKAGAEVVGVDLSRGVLEIARKNNPQIKYVQADLRKLPFKNQSFDGVWAHASLLHLPSLTDVKKALTEFHRVLEEGGIIHIYVRAQIGENKTAFEKDKLSPEGRFFRYFTKDELDKLIQQTGFSLIEVNDIGDLHRRKTAKGIALFAKKT